MKNLYDTPPPDYLFDELKIQSIKVWREVGLNKKYILQKTNRIGFLPNTGDNFMFIVAMFDHKNQQRLSRYLSPQCRNAVYVRLVAGGTPDLFNRFK